MSSTSISAGQGSCTPESSAIGQVAAAPPGAAHLADASPRHSRLGRIVAVLTQLGIMNVAVGAGGLIRNKVLAVYLKPDGFGEFTQLTAIAAAIYVFVQFGMAVGLSRHAAAQREMRDRQRQLSVANTLTVGLAVGSLALLLPALFAPGSNSVLSALGIPAGLSQKLFLAVLLAAAPIEALRNNFLCFLQGILDFKGMSAKRTLAIIVSTLVAVPLIAWFGTAGACVQMVGGSLFLAILLARRCRHMGYRPFEFKWDKRVATTLAGWGGACLVSGFALNSVDTLIRGRLIAHAGLAANGLYQSSSLLSGQIMTVILGSIGAYSLATLSETTNAGVAKQRMEDLLRVIVPLTTLSLGLLGLFSAPLLSLLFSSSFRGAATFFPLQLSANYLQSAGWIVGAPLLGFGFVRTWMSIQLVGAAIRYGSTLLFFPSLGAHAVPAGFVTAVAFDLIANIVFCRLCLGIRFERRTQILFCLGGVAIVACANIGDGRMFGHSSGFAWSAVLAMLALGGLVVTMAWPEFHSAWPAIRARLRR